MQITLDATLVLWEKRELPERRKNPQTNEWENTGTKVERTMYTFRDEFGEVVKFLGDNEYRQFEGSDVRLFMDINYNDYTNTNRIQLKSIEQLA